MKITVKYYCIKVIQRNGLLRFKLFYQTFILVVILLIDRSIPPPKDSASNLALTIII